MEKMPSFPLHVVIFDVYGQINMTNHNEAASAVMSLPNSCYCEWINDVTFIFFWNINVV